jgi:tetratricopeptide (TPR) repeat protein
MSPSVENILTLADRDLAAGRYGDAEREYSRALELDPDLYTALHSRGVARTWRSTLLDGDPVALIASTQDAFRMCEKAGGDADAFLNRVAIDLINLTSTKYNELTRIYISIARKENQKAPSPLFFYTWSLSHPQGLTLSDIYIPLINYLAAIIKVSEYLDELLKDKKGMEHRRLHNVGNLETFYDWLIAFNATGRVQEEYYNQTVTKKQYLQKLRAQLEDATNAPEFQNVPLGTSDGRPLPGVAAEADVENKVAHFGTRPPFEVICPVCGTMQKSNRSICFQCSCKFFFDDEINK